MLSTIKYEGQVYQERLLSFRLYLSNLQGALFIIGLSVHHPFFQLTGLVFKIVYQVKHTFVRYKK